MPAGVPVKMTSPGSNGRIADSSLMIRGTLKTMSEVRLSCISSSFTQQRIARSSRFDSSSGVTRHGPIGPKVGNDFPERELPTARPLHDPLGDVLPHREPRDMIPRRLLGDPLRANSHHHHELDLPVDGAARQDHVGVRTSEARRKLGEHRQSLGNRKARLGGVCDIVEADAEDLRRSWRRRPEIEIAHRNGAGSADRGRPRTEGRPLGEDGLRVGGEATLRRVFNVDLAPGLEQREPSRTLAMRISLSWYSAPSGWIPGAGGL